jgi:hypothetical protein
MGISSRKEVLFHMVARFACLLFEPRRRENAKFREGGTQIIMMVMISYIF